MFNLLTDEDCDEIISLFCTPKEEIATLTDEDCDEIISLFCTPKEEIVQKKERGEETKTFLFKDAGRVYFLWIKKLTSYALKKKYVQDSSSQKEEEAKELAVDFLIECAEKNKFKNYCEERRFGYIQSTMFSQWNTRRRERLGKQAGVRGLDSRFKTQTDKLKGEALPSVTSTHSISYDGEVELKDMGWRGIVYDPQQPSVEDQVALNQLLQTFDLVIKSNCKGDAEKYKLWKELGRNFIEYNLYNRKLYESDTTFSEHIGISLPELRKNKNELKKALASSRELRAFL